MPRTRGESLGLLGTYLKGESSCLPREPGIDTGVTPLRGASGRLTRKTAD